METIDLSEVAAFTDILYAFDIVQEPMRVKLEYLIHAASGRPPPSHQLPKLELISMKHMSSELKRELLLNLILCLCGLLKQSSIGVNYQYISPPSKPKKGYLKRNGTSLLLFRPKSDWPGYAVVSLVRGEVLRLNFTERGFIFPSNGHNAILVTVLCRRTLLELRELLSVALQGQLIPKLVNLKSMASTQCSSTYSSYFEPRFSFEAVNQELSSFCLIIQPEKGRFQKQLQDDLKAWQFGAYEMRSVTSRGRIALRQTDQTLKGTFEFRDCLATALIHRFLHFEAWNSIVETSSIVNRLQANTYIVKVTWRSESRFLWPRESLVGIIVQTNSNGLSTIRIRPVDIVQDYQLSSNIVLQTMDQFLIVKQKYSDVQLIIYSRINTGGYENDLNRQNLRFVQQLGLLQQMDEKLSPYEQLSLLPSETPSLHLIIQDKSVEYSHMDPNSTEVVKLREKELEGEVVRLIQKGQFSANLLRLIRLNKHCNLVLGASIDQTQAQLVSARELFFEQRGWRIDGEWLEPAGRSKTPSLSPWEHFKTKFFKATSLMDNVAQTHLYEPVTYLQKCVGILGCMPQSLDVVLQSTDTALQCKILLQALLIGLLDHLCESVPLRPILGETYNMKMGADYAYAQQISIDPRITALLLVHQKATLYGSINLEVERRANSIVCYSQSFLQVKLNGAHFKLRLPSYQIAGIVQGARRFRLFGTMYAYEAISDTYCELHLGQRFSGGVYTVTNKFAQKLDPVIIPILSQNDCIEAHSVLEGQWQSSVNGDPKSFPNLDSHSYALTMPCKGKLPSDTIFRQDLLSLSTGNLQTANYYSRILLDQEQRDAQNRKDHLVNGRKQAIL